MSDPALISWFRRAITVMVAEAERGHGAVVQRRAWRAGAAAAYATQRKFDASPLGVVADLPMPSASYSTLMNDFTAFAHTLPWKPSPRLDDGGDTVGLVDLFECIDIDLAGAGLILLGPGASYPEHQHKPAEVYLVVHGARRWRFGGSERYRKIESGEVISNSSNDIHGIQACDEVMLGLWVLMDDR